MCEFERRHCVCPRYPLRLATSRRLSRGASLPRYAEEHQGRHFDGMNCVIVLHSTVCLAGPTPQSHLFMPCPTITSPGRGAVRSFGVERMATLTPRYPARTVRARDADLSTTSPPRRVLFVFWLTTLQLSTRTTRD